MQINATLNVVPRRALRNYMLQEMQSFASEYASLYAILNVNDVRRSYFGGPDPS